MLGISTTNVRVGGFRGKGVDANAQTIYNRIIADGGVSNLTRLNFFVKGLKAIYGDLANVPVCYDAHWIGYKLGSGTGATSGQAAAKLYSLTVAGDAVQATAASQPLLLAHNGDNYAWLPAINGNYFSTPSSTANRITGDIEMIGYIDLFTLSGSQTIIGKWGDCYVFKINSAALYFQYYNSGSTLRSHTSTNTIALGAKWVRVTRNNTTGEVKFYTSSDAVTTPILSITWTQLGTTISGTVESIQLTTQIVTVGAENDGATNKFSGKIYRATISNSIGGTPVVDFNPATYNASTSQTAWTSATGEIWTISTGTATTGYKGVLVDRTIVQSDGVDDTITSNLTGSGQKTQYFAIRMFTYTNWIGGLFFSNNARGGFTTTGGKLAAYAGGASVGPFGTANDTKLKEFSFLLGSTGTNWEVQENGANVSNGGIDIGTNGTFDNVTIFSRGGGSSFQNMIWSTYIISSNPDNSTIKTATYNLIRSLNNSAF